MLRKGYLPQHLLGSAHSVLKACALTYVAGALLDVLRLWRWIRLFRQKVLEQTRDDSSSTYQGCNNDSNSKSCRCAKDRCHLQPLY
ncbi:zinc metallopeptidase [Microbulbifer celer]|nr:zinc metallopeptidase [Microbulbifer celer]